MKTVSQSHKESSNPSPGQNWQPIETAPKDGTKILAFKHHPKTYWVDMLIAPRDEIAVAWWHVTTTEDEVDAGDGLYRKVKRIVSERWIKGWDMHIPMGMNPTHWIPLPAAPTNGSESK